MSKVYEFLNECGVFYVLTMKDGKPCGRPFGAVMEYNGKIYITTSNTKDVYKQMKNNDNIQIVALKNGTRDWIRIDGNAKECFDLRIKKRMLEECPVLKNRYSFEDCEYYALFKVENIQANLNVDGKFFEVN